MKLSNFFEKLSYGELSNLYIGASGSGEIPTEQYKKIFSHINHALTNIYTRFPIKVRDLTIQSYDHISLYHLKSEYSWLNTDSDAPTYKYLIDTPSDRFTDDIIMIESVYNEIGQELPMNDADAWASVFVVNQTTLQINHPSNEDAFMILYRANHPMIPMDLTDLDTFELDIPVSIEEALAYYVAGRIYTNMNGQEHSAKGQEFLAKFEAQCNFIEQYNTFSTSIATTNVKPLLNGWV